MKIHRDFLKVAKTIESCETQQQLSIASRMSQNFIECYKNFTNVYETELSYLIGTKKVSLLNINSKPKASE